MAATTLVDRHSTVRTRRHTALVVIALALLGSTFGIQAASADDGSQPQPLGIVPPVAPTAAASVGRLAAAAPSSFTQANMTYHGGSVMHASQAYTIFWIPSSYTVSSGYQSIINGFLQNVAAASGAATNVYANDTQYTDGSGPIAYSASYGGTTVDTHAFPASGCTNPGGRPVCLTDAQLRAEIQSIVTAKGWSGGANKEFFLFTPRNVSSCWGSSCAYRAYCAYHSWIGSGSTAIIYANQPYAGSQSGCDVGQHPNGDDADGTINVLSHEHIESITDPMQGGWWDGSGQEIGDKCAWTFGTPLGGSNGSYYNQAINGAHYYLQQEWDNSSTSCVLTASTAVTQFSVTAPTTGTAGQPVSITVTARTNPTSVATGYVGTIHLTSSDGAAVLPDDYTFLPADKGVHTFPVTFMTAGSDTVTATDTGDSSIRGTSAADAVAAGSVTHLGLTAPTTATVDSPFSVTVSALNQFNAPVAAYTGTVHFACTDANTVNTIAIPGDYTFTGAGHDNGQHTFSGIALETAGAQVIRATDTVTTSLTVASRVTVGRGATSGFTLVAPATSIAGKPITIRVKAIDAGGNVIPTYTGTVDFTSSDDAALLPASYTFVPGDHGLHGFSLKLFTAGTATITATDHTTGSITVTSGSIAVAPGTVTHLSFTVGDTTPTVDTPFAVTVTAANQFGAPVAGYTGTAHFTSSDANTFNDISLPADYTFDSNDGGVHTFTNGFTLETVGSQAIRAWDGTVGGAARVTVGIGSVAAFRMVGPAAPVRGVARTVAVAAIDAGGNVVTGYVGTISFSSTDHGATLPADYTFVPGDHGRHAFPVTFATAGAQTVTVDDGTITTTLSGITVH